MGVVSADTLQLSHVAETTPGVTPSSPTFNIWRTTGESLIFQPNTSESGELGGSGRFSKPPNVTGQTIQGDINFELCRFTALDEAIAGVMAGNWGECPLTGASGGAIDNPNRITVGEQLKTFTIEKRFPNPANVPGTALAVAADPAPAATVDLTVSGTATGTGVAVIDLAQDNGEVKRFDVYHTETATDEEFATSIAAAIDADEDYSASATLAVVTVTPAGSQITTADVRAGSDEYYYQRYKGASYSVLNLTTSPNNPVTGAVTIVGGVPELDSLPLTGATYTAAGSGEVFTAPEVMDATVGGIVTVGTHCWTTLTINIDSQNRGIPCIGSTGDRETVLGTVQCVLSGDIYFSDQEILEALLANETVGDGLVTFSNNDNEIYRFDLYSLKITGGSLAAGGTGQDLTIPAEMSPTPVTVCDDGSEVWESGLVLSKENTAPTLP